MATLSNITHGHFLLLYDYNGWDEDGTFISHMIGCTECVFYF